MLRVECQKKCNSSLGDLKMQSACALKACSKCRVLAGLLDIMLQATRQA
jgi:hypothetical protein